MTINKSQVYHTIIQLVPFIIFTLMRRPVQVLLDSVRPGYYTTTKAKLPCLLNLVTLTLILTLYIVLTRIVEV